MSQPIAQSAQTKSARIAARYPHWARAASLLLAIALLGGCGDTRKTLGLDKTVPDEFKIVSRAPLSLPPDYALRPPQPGAVRPQERTIPERALAAVTGTQLPQASTSTTSSGEMAFLAHAGADRANPGIRDILERENSTLSEADTTFLDRLMFWRKPEDLSPVVDAERESQRLRENAALGRPTNDGDVPTIRRRKKALLEGIL
jgi:hypothetical protein